MKPFVLDQSDVDFSAEAALAYCTDCLDYHLVRPYQLASGWPLGPERDKVVFGPMLHRLTPSNGRILIAGSADAGLLAFALDADGDLNPTIIVADRCEAPLAVCRRYAAKRGASIETVTADLVMSPPPGPFDVIVAHLILRFIPPKLRVEFLRGLAEQLRPGGTLILAHLGGRDQGASRVMRERILAGLAARGITIASPQILLASIERLEQRPRDASREVDELDQIVAAADLTIVADNAVATDGERPRRYLGLRPR